MSFTIIKKTDRVLKFESKDVDLSIMNGLRRVALSHVENIAIAWDPYHEELSDIKMITNTSSLHNEFLSHRISLVPVCVSEDEVESWDKNIYKFVIHKTNMTKEPIWLTTRDIDVYHAETGKKLDDSDRIRERLFPCDEITKDYIVLTKLKDNETVHVEFRSRKGTAHQHARWCPISMYGYEQKMDMDQVNEARAKVGDDPAALNRFDKIDACRMVMRNRKGEPNQLVITLESECKLTPAYLIDQSFKFIVSSLNAIHKGEKMSVSPISVETHMFGIEIADEDHTLGNLIYQLAMNHYIENEKKEKEADPIDYIGYYQPHPLKRNLLFKLRFRSSAWDPLTFFKSLIQTVTKDVMNVHAEWLKTVQSKPSSKKNK
jgi:DNA-directed RNA polymerase subunit L